MGIRNSEALVQSIFLLTEDGNPSGGCTQMDLDVGDQVKSALLISWQNGVVENGQQNGAFVEDVLEAVRQRLLFFNESGFRCRENSIAITKVEEALQWLDWRTRNRLLQNVENSYEKHA